MSLTAAKVTAETAHRAIRTMLASYASDHPDARIDSYAWGDVSVQVRIIDPAFASMSLSNRHRTLNRYLKPLSEAIQAKIGLFLLLAPQEVEASCANDEFEHPLPVPAPLA